MGARLTPWPAAVACSRPRSMRRAILTEIVRKNVKNAIAKSITKANLEKSMATVQKDLEPFLGSENPQGEGVCLFVVRTT